MKFLTTSAVVLAAVLAAPTTAGTVVPGFDTNVALGPNDDNATGPLSIGFGANFFGTTYTNTYISNNGYLTFNTGQGTFTPGGLGAGYSGQPIIAAFFGDVDTRGAGTTTYGYGTYAGHSAFGATWTGVGYYAGATDKLNSFQILMTDRGDTGAGNFDIYYNYDQIQWETGGASGGSGGLGGISAAVGFNAGSGNSIGTYFELAGSRVPGSFIDGGTTPLTALTNDGTPGLLLFQVRNGGVVVPPVGGVPEPAAWALMIVGFGLVGTSMRRHSAAAAA